jgi:membrane protein YdbS with pleckstrin-like domain
LLLDDILCGRVEPAPKAVAAEPFPLLLESPRAAGNAVVKLIFLSVLIIPLIVLLPITLPLTVVWAKRWRYRLESARIVVAWGVVYRSETSVLLDRVDSLQQGRGPLNKLFGNGTIRIMTAGSSKPDLTLIDSTGCQALHEAIRANSK